MANPHTDIKLVFGNEKSLLENKLALIGLQAQAWKWNEMKAMCEGLKKLLKAQQLMNFVIGSFFIFLRCSHV